MPTINLSMENFRQHLDKEGIVLIDWWAPWCGPCRTFAPVFESASEKHGDLVFAKINTDDEEELAGEFQIQAIPTLMAFRDRILVFSQAGALPAAALEELIAQVRALDMEEVRKEVERAEQEHAEHHHGDEEEDEW